MDQTPIANKKITNDLQTKKRGQALHASDYLAKAVNSEQLLSALRSWLHR